VLTYGRKAMVQTVELPLLRIGELRFENVSAQVGALSLPAMDRRVRIDALIGLELMRRTGLSIDYEAHKVFFGPVDHSSSFFPFYGMLPIVSAPMTVRGHRVRVLLDTGAEHVVLFQRATEGRIRMKRTGEKLPIRYMGGKARLSGVRLTDVRMGTSYWNQLPAYLLDGPNPHDHLDGVLGTGSLGLKRLNLDFAGNLISWER
jgi:predicted aspartyl protease